MKLFNWLFKKNPIWIYGTCKERPARKHRINGNVQFVIWYAGEQGYKEDCWINFDNYWWNDFKQTTTS